MKRLRSEVLEGPEYQTYIRTERFVNDGGLDVVSINATTRGPRFGLFGPPTVTVVIWYWEETGDAVAKE